MNLSSTRINQNGPRNGRAVGGRPQAAPQPPRPQVQQANTLSNYGTTTRIRSLYPGQIIKGEVSDLRNTEIVVTLENNTIVAGKLTNGSWLAIGETAAFKVASATQENIILEALPKPDMTLAGSTIQKALEEAGLPKTERNQQIVLELMNNQLPIHKQAIQQMMQQSILHKDIAIPTLVLMNKLQIPITTEYAQQFEKYQTNSHSLSNDLQALSMTLSDLLKQMAKGTEITSNTPTMSTPETELENLNTEIPVDTTSTAPVQSASTDTKNMLLQQLFQNNGTTTTQQQPFQVTASRILSSILDAAATPDTFQRSVLSDAPIQLNEAEQQELFSILENFDFPENMQEDLHANTASLREVIHLIHKDFEEAYALDKQNNPSIAESDTAIPTSTDANTKGETILRTSLFDSPVIQNIEDQFTKLQQRTQELGGKIGFNERLQFSKVINNLPLDESIKERVHSGEIQSNELLRTIKTVLPFSEDNGAADLLTSDTFHKLLQDEFMHAFLLSPKEIFREGGVEHYYHKLSKQLEELDDIFQKQLLSNTTITSEQLSSSLASNAKENVQQLKDNIDFMRLLNQFFSYVQLPVKLQEKFTHADLYVYTRKKKLENQNNPIHVLLRLDMDNLGPLDVDVQLNGRTVTTHFALNNDKGIKLLQKNLPLLEDALLEKGYLCNSTVEKLEKEVDLIKTFVAPDIAPSGLSRYSFDLRA